MAIDTSITPREAYFGSPESEAHKPNRNDLVSILEQVLSAVALGPISYIRSTKAELDALSGVSEGEGGVVTTGSDAGFYEYSSSVWGLVASLPSTDIIASGGASGSLDGALNSLQEAGLFKFSGSGPIYPLIVDENNKAILWYDEDADVLKGEGLTDRDTVLEYAQIYLKQIGLTSDAGTADVLASIIDQDNRVILGHDRATGTPVGTLVNALRIAGPTDEVALDPSLTITPAAYNGMHAQGQSLSIGYKADPALTTSQPYSNVTFNSGVRATGASFTSFIPLVEADETGQLGETICSTAANYAISLAAENQGTATNSHVIVASTGGSGGYTIAQLSKPNFGYTKWFDHIEGAYALDNDYAVHMVPWMQGEQDAFDATAYATYKAALAQFQSDAETDTQAETGQTSPVFLVTYQTSYGVATHDDVAQAQLDLAAESDRVFMTIPSYHLPHDADGVHLTNEATRVHGAHFGRAYDAIRRGYEPKWLRPKWATVRGAVVRVRFDVPYRPLTLDTVGMAETTDYGLKVTDGGASTTITAVDVDGDDLVITLSAAPSGEVIVRYALDYLAETLTITNGASGNVRDSNPATITAGSTVYPLWNPAPHFSITATAIGE